MKLLITGGSRGIGRAIADQARQSGHDILIVARNADRIKQVCEEFNESLQGKAIGFACDIAHIEEQRRLLTHCLDAGFIPQCLVLNAGIFIEGALASAEPGAFEETLSVDFLSVYHTVQLFLPLLRQQTNAKIIIIGSTAAYEPYPIGALYGVAKWALRGYAINLRKELMVEGIGVTFVSPGGTLTDLWEGEELPPARLLEPSDIGKMVIACLSLSPQAVVEELIVRPMLGDMHE